MISRDKWPAALVAEVREAEDRYDTDLEEIRALVSNEQRVRSLLEAVRKNRTCDALIAEAETAINDN